MQSHVQPSKSACPTGIFPGTMKHDDQTLDQSQAWHTRAACLIIHGDTKCGYRNRPRRKYEQQQLVQPNFPENAVHAFTQPMNLLQTALMWCSADARNHHRAVAQVNNVLWRLLRVVLSVALLDRMSCLAVIGPGLFTLGLLLVPFRA